MLSNSFSCVELWLVRAGRKPMSCSLEKWANMPEPLNPGGTDKTEQKCYC